MATFRCCGNQSTEGHADDCALKPSSVTFPARDAPPEPEEGCQFDILHFEHIGECKGTCDGQGDGIKQLTQGAISATENKIVLVDLSNATEEDIKELEKRGFKRLTEQEMTDIMSEYDAGEIEVEIITMTLEELLEEYPVLDGNAQPAEASNPFLTIKEAAEALQFSESWTRTLCRTMRLSGAMKLGRRWAIPYDAIYEED